MTSYKSQTKILRCNFILIHNFNILGSSDKEQLMYTETRLEDLQSMTASNTPNVNLRVFSGDNPARQFEAGQQRGGHYSCVCGVKAVDHKNLIHCFRHEQLSLEQRRTLITKGQLWKKMERGETNPFQRLRKEEIATELENHNIWTDKETKSELSNLLTQKLHGICRPPALMCKDPLKSAKDINVNNYEVLSCEPLHDITNIVQNIIMELPFQVPKEIQKEFETFSITTIGDKNQIKGSDARLFAVKLAKFIKTNYDAMKIEEKFLVLVNSLVEIIQISYSNFSIRNPRNILRLYNQCFTFAILSRNIFGNPAKLTSRKFFRSHFHSITVHLPETYRLFCLRSIIPEQEERSFGDLRRISLQTTNRQAKYVVDNAVLRFTIQQKINSKPDTIKKQDSVISHQAKLLDKRSNSIFKEEFIQKNPLLFQAHLERIADFMLAGEGIWWSKNGEDVEFFDGVDEPCTRLEGPELHNFRSSDLQKEQMYITSAWKRCTANYAAGHLHLPIKRIRVYDENKCSFIYPPKGMNSVLSKIFFKQRFKFLVKNVNLFSFLIKISFLMIADSNNPATVNMGILQVLHKDSPQPAKQVN